MEVKPLLKFINNKEGFLGLTLSQIGVFIATGIILAAVFSFIYYSQWQREAELKNMATGLSSLIEGMDTRFFENKTLYYFDRQDYNYNVSISSEYLIINADSTWLNELSIKHRFSLRPWPRKNNSNWVSADQLHNYLRFVYGRSGERSDPINKSDIDDVKNYISSEWKNANKTLVKNPFYVKKIKPLYIEKVFIYYNTDNIDGWNKINDKKQGFILLYQLL